MTYFNLAKKRVIVLTGLIFLISCASGAYAQQPPPDSTNPGQSPMDQLSLTNQQPDVYVLPPSTQPEKKLNPFFADSKFSLQVRSFYFYRDKFDDSKSEAWALGGSASFKSGYLGNFFALGAVAYTSQPLYAPDDRDGTGLLKPGQDGYTVLGQIYGEFKLADTIFAAVGRKEYNTPFINKNDTRMTPNTFEGATFYGTAGGKDDAPAWRFGGGYIDKIKPQNSTDFIWMSHDAGANAERGVFLGGANVDWKRWSVGAIDYYSDDIINIFYTEAKYSLLKGDGHELKLAGQFTQQNSTGEDLLTGSNFPTNQFGGKADLTLGSAIFTLAYTQTANGADMTNPWGGYPGYTSVQVEDFFRAGEQAAMIRAGYDFTEMGLKGVSTYALWVHGFGVTSVDHNEDEFDGNLQWTPPEGKLKGTSVRFRYAYVLQHGDGDPNIQDVRLILNYDF